MTFVGGVDYEIKEEGGADWLPFPNLPELAKIRHTWIIVRNERPSIPSFCKAPMPRKHEGNEERNAQIVMTYLHPFTLQTPSKDKNIPHASKLRRGETSWVTAMTTWMEGEILTHESRNYIQNFFCVAQMRPDFIPEANKNEEDIFSDEEIDMNTIGIDELLRTHTGTACAIEDQIVQESEDSNARKQTQQAMERSNEFWKSDGPPQGDDRPKKKRTTVHACILT